MTGAETICLLHGPRQSFEECKLLKEYSQNLPLHIKIMNPALEGKQTMVSLSSSTAESRRPTSWSMVILFLRKKRVKIANNHKNKSAKVDQKDCENIYGIGNFKLVVLIMIKMNPIDFLCNAG